MPSDKTIKRIQTLKDRFEELKDQCADDNGGSTISTLASRIIVPMLKLNLDEGCKMWEYLLERYYNHIAPVDFHKLTDGIVEKSDIKVLAKVFKTNEVIKKYVFLLDPYENHLFCEWLIRDLVLLEDYELANELLTLYSQNTNGENNAKENLYSVLYQAITSQESCWKINTKGVDFISEWILKINSKKKRTILEAAIEELTDCVEGNASKSAMPFNMFTEDGTDKLIKERTKSSSEYMLQCNNENTDLRNTAVSRSKTPLIAEEIEQNLDELNSLIGLQNVKTEVTSLINLMRIQRLRSEHGLKTPDTSQHLVFSGNPGTGKTTVARIIGKVYHALGFLSSGHLVEVDRSGLVAGYVGQTAIKTQEVIQNALGGILFIDEAYSLYHDGSDNDFGREAINTLLKAMEDHRENFVVIVAGYNEPMKNFINSNPGLRSRFNKYIDFPDYTGNELFEIFQAFFNRNDYSLCEDAAIFAEEYFSGLYENRCDNFGNARDVRNLFEKIISKQANRLANTRQLTTIELSEIRIEDLKDILS